MPGGGAPGGPVRKGPGAVPGVAVAAGRTGTAPGGAGFDGAPDGAAGLGKVSASGGFAVADGAAAADGAGGGAGAAAGACAGGGSATGLRRAALAAASLATLSDSAWAAAAASEFARSWKCVRTLSAADKSIELECVFFSVTPASGR